jgi:hypothetical protein
VDKFLIKQRIRELVSIIYDDYSGVGGKLHIVLDDGNLDDCSINWCLNNSIAEITNEEEKKIYTECAELLLKLSYSSRKRTLNS